MHTKTTGFDINNGRRRVRFNVVCPQKRSVTIALSGLDSRSNPPVKIATMLTITSFKALTKKQGGDDTTHAMFGCNLELRP